MKTILITGGGRGLGLAAARKLAALPDTRVLITARTIDACYGLVSNFRRRKLNVEAFPLKLDEFASVQALPKELTKAGVDRLDVLILSAAVMQQSESRRVTPDGLEETMQVNVVSQVTLINLLEGFLSKSSKARIVMLSSSLHFLGSRGRPVDFNLDDPYMEQGYNPERAYKNSKLGVLWMTYDLQKQFKQKGLNIKINAFCPGFVAQTASASARQLHTWFMLRVLLTYLPFSFVTSLDDAAREYEYMALNPFFDSLEGGGFFTRVQREPLPDESKTQKVMKWARTKYEEIVLRKDKPLIEMRLTASSPESYDEVKRQKFMEWISAQLPSLKV